jgi:acyl-CoA hydrolase
MDTFTHVRPEHLNHYGYLFGGQLLKWVDEHAWLVATLDFPGYHLVTRAMAESDFKTPVANGSILRFIILPHSRGKTSITYGVDVLADEPGALREKPVFTTMVTFACVDDVGRKRALPAARPLRSEGAARKGGQSH